MNREPGESVLSLVASTEPGTGGVALGTVRTQAAARLWGRGWLLVSSRTCPHPVLISSRSCPTPTPRLLRPLDVLGPARATQSAATATSRVRQDQPRSASGSGVTCAPFARLCSGEACPLVSPGRPQLVIASSSSPAEPGPPAHPPQQVRPAPHPCPPASACGGPPGYPAPLPAASCTPWLDRQL